MHTDPLLTRIDQYLDEAPRTLCEAVEAPLFRLFMNRASDSPYLSYARPNSERTPKTGQNRPKMTQSIIRIHIPGNPRLFRKLALPANRPPILPKAKCNSHICRCHAGEDETRPARAQTHKHLAAK